MSLVAQSCLGNSGTSQPSHGKGACNPAGSQTLVLFFFVCVCVRAGAGYACVQEFMCLCARGGHRRISDFCSITINLRVYIVYVACSLERLNLELGQWLTNRSEPPSSWSFLLVLGLQVHLVMPDFSSKRWNSNSAPHDCAASPSAHWFSSQPKLSLRCLGIEYVK